jgi:hypothetical protein
LACWQAEYSESPKSDSARQFKSLSLKKRHLFGFLAHEVRAPASLFTLVFSFR